MRMVKTEAGWKRAGELTKTQLAELKVIEERLRKFYLRNDLPEGGNIDRALNWLEKALEKNRA